MAITLAMFRRTDSELAAIGKRLQIPADNQVAGKGKRCSISQSTPVWITYIEMALVAKKAASCDKTLPFAPWKRSRLFTVKLKPIPTVVEIQFAGIRGMFIRLPVSQLKTTKSIIVFASPTTANNPK